MATKKYKSTSNGLRQREVLVHDGYRGPAEPSLLKPLKKKSGRNNTGKITVRHRGGGSRRQYRQITFSKFPTVPGRIVRFEYDPNRTAAIALVVYENGAKGYILAPSKSKVGDVIVSGEKAEVRPGNALPLHMIPTGADIHNVEINIGGGAKLVRSAGASATLLSKHGNYAMIKLPSGEVRKVHVNCYAVIGQVGNSDNRNKKIGKAGANRWRGRRPVVRGAAMNACDHPHGGGEGKAPVGAAGPRTKWGKSVFKKTRKKNKQSNALIVRVRK
jgi:large subunit ribosomal protein L2